MTVSNFSPLMVMRRKSRLLVFLVTVLIVSTVIYLVFIDDCCFNTKNSDHYYQHRLGHHQGQHNFQATHRPPPFLRILVLAYNRAKSLSRCLDSLNSAEYDGHHVTVEVHVDRSRDGHVDDATVAVAKGFVFKHGEVKVYVKPRHGGVVGQWMASWQLPLDNSSEVALFLEDDITVSRYFARWLWMVHEKYDSYPSVNGYSLQGESIRHATDAVAEPLQGPAGQTVFLYPVLGSWGFSPNTESWRDFLRWYQNVTVNSKGFIPHVPSLQPSHWYVALHKAGRAETMWTMWHIYFSYMKHQYTLYPNLPEHQGLVFNWKEPGMHYSAAEMGKGIRENLLSTWREEDLRLPETLVILDARGDVTGKLDPPW